MNLETDVLVIGGGVTSAAKHFAQWSRAVVWILLFMLPTIALAQEATDTPDGGLPRSEVGQILFRRDFDVYVVDADGNNERNLTETLDDISDATWMPNGTQIVFYYLWLPDEIYLMQADGSQIELLAQ